jgi:thioredoxin-like negative regulator of GroEL
LGAYDSLPLAKSFTKRNKMSVVKMLWDKDAKSWEYYGVPGQPAALLIKNGEVVASWAGAIDEEELLGLVNA